MNFEKIEAAYELVLENTQTIQSQLHTNLYEALIEQNTAYVKADHHHERVVANNVKLTELALTQEEWQRVFQFIFIKANQTEPLQYNHQFTPDSIGLLINFLIEELLPKQELDIIEIGSGMGNLAQTLLNYSSKKLDYLGIESDDLLIDLSASIADVLSADLSFIQGDAARPHLFKASDVIISDLPIGYYPDDSIAQRFKVGAKGEHTYAHHLFMEQSLKYLKTEGYAIFLAPNDLLTSPQSDLLKSWLTASANLLAMIALPEEVFVKKELAKSLFIFQKKGARHAETFVYPLFSLQDVETLKKFRAAFKKWRQENAK